MKPSVTIAQAREGARLGAPGAGGCKSQVVPIEDERYPAWLRAIHDPPPVLYCDGVIEPSDRLAVAIVGARQATPYGLRITEALARDLAGLGCTIVSGMARGIDAAAHRGALAAGGRTIAVLGCGLDVVYPPEHDKLRAEIADAGAVVTEFPMGTPPKASHFPRRNRIISGLALGVVVVEAAEDSGSLITARSALDQGREVFAVPGPIDAPLSRGPHGLLKQGAKLVETVADIIEELLPQLEGSSLETLLDQDRAISHPPGRPLAISELGVPRAPGRVLDPGSAAGAGKRRSFSSEPPNLTPDERIVYALISETPVHIDELMELSRLAPAAVAGALVELELKSAVRRMPGQQYIRVR